MTTHRAPAHAAVVLAGGRSSRMGQDKASTLLAGRSLLDWTLDAIAGVPTIGEIVLVLARGQDSPVRSDLPIRLVRDREDFGGPLAAIAEGLGGIEGDATLLLGCDTPFLEPALLRLLLDRTRGHPVVLPVHEGRVQPLCSAIHRDAFPAVRALARGTRAASALADLPGTLRLEDSAWRAVDPEGCSFLGVNTPEELNRAEALALRHAGGAR